MTIDKGNLLLRLDSSLPLESVDLARTFLTSADLEPVSESPARVRVSEAIRLWSTRAKNVRFTKKPIQGVEWLLRRLETLGSQDELEQFSFTGREFTGSLFFKLNEEFVGVVLVDRVSAADPSLTI